MYMPLQVMEKYLYPTLRVMQHLHEHKGRYDYIPGGVESMIVYSYFHKGGGIPQNRTERDLRVRRVDPPPPSVPAPTKARTSGQRVTTNDLIVNAAYHSVISSANTEPYAVPTSQRPPPLQQQAIRPARVSLDYRRADQPPLALIEDAPPMEESSSAAPMPNPDLPADRWRNGGKGKRPPPQRASRQPAKYARNDDDLVISLPPLRGGSFTYTSSSRSAQSSEPVIPRPPNANRAPEPALQTKSSSRPKLTPSRSTSV